ncbi:hypothetical protein Salmuc_00084 [Salipiger mucosus DSM 16094]|uniref:Uncharacterized protein n=1 Tax=Salipiger mucosus DSM 16094 TaxID=1123237 RepID=S9Q2U3_9RHOB|nr:hypothetical protein Salmuc_00084 [Salipiger mucosus DSM 16094]
MCDNAAGMVFQGLQGRSGLQTDYDLTASASALDTGSIGEKSY